VKKGMWVYNHSCKKREVWENQVFICEDGRQYGDFNMSEFLLLFFPMCFLMSSSFSTELEQCKLCNMITNNAVLSYFCETSCKECSVC